MLNAGDISRRHRTQGGSRAVRLDNFDYAADTPIHLTLCAPTAILTELTIGRMICDSVETCCRQLAYTLYGFCLMPDHLHVLLSPRASRIPVDRWLRDFKSFTTNQFMKLGGTPPLWQRSAHDHVCRATETAETVLMYIANNPIRRGLVNDWQEWPWTKVFVEL